jgi:uncharacterized protein YdaU (DUF1376 family)
VNYYEHHLGDYMRDTAHLSLIEDGAYRRLLDAYYIRERPLPADVRECCKLARASTKPERAAVGYVLGQFFKAEADGHHQVRADDEIAKFQDKQGKARSSANKRWGKGPDGVLLCDPPVIRSDVRSDMPTDLPTNIHPDMRTHSEGNAPHARPQSPVPSPQEKKDAVASLVGKADRRPPCPTEAIVALWHEVLPELRAVRVLGKKRRATIAEFWQWVFTTRKSNGQVRATTSEEALTWTRGYFGRARDNDFVMGRSARSPGHENWICDIDYLLSERGISQVLERTQAAAA